MKASHTKNVAWSTIARNIRSGTRSSIEVFDAFTRDLWRKGCCQAIEKSMLNSLHYAATV